VKIDDRFENKPSQLFFSSNVRTKEGCYSSALGPHSWNSQAKPNHSKPIQDYCKGTVPNGFVLYTAYRTVVLLLWILRTLQQTQGVKQLLATSRYVQSSDCRDGRKREPFVSLVSIVRDPSVVEPGHKQNKSQNTKSDAVARIATNFLHRHDEAKDDAERPKRKERHRERNFFQRKTVVHNEGAATHIVPN